MRLIILSLFMYVSAVVFYITSGAATLDGDASRTKITFLTILCMIIICEAVWQFIKQKRLQTHVSHETAEAVDNTKLSAEKAEAQSRADALHEEARKLKEQLSSSQSKVTSLENALVDANKSAQQSKKAASSRSVDVEAELAHFLGILQDRGRLVDFLMNDIAPHSDDEVGRVARVVHQGCSSVLNEYFSIAKLDKNEEQSQVTINDSQNRDLYRFSGQVSDSPPYKGTLLHAGWKTSRVAVPRLSQVIRTEEAYLVSPAEVEVK
jgi:FtsZ-binding cell division protein ZapB